MKHEALVSLRPAVALAIVAWCGTVALMAVGCAGGAKPASGDAPPAPPKVRVEAARLVCRLIADNPGAARVQVTGADGAQSLPGAGSTYWFFGDTVRRGDGGRSDVIPATVATTSDTDARDCVDLTFKSSGGLAEPLFPRREETTAWPDGVVRLPDGSAAFYMVKAVRTSPFAWHVSAVGIGTIAPGALTGVRVNERLWDETSGFGSRVAGARSPVVQGDDVLVYLHTEAGANYVAKAPIARLADASAYTYWNGAEWDASPANAQPMWPVEPDALPPDNGVQVTYDEPSGAWWAVTNTHMATVDLRTAPSPVGPWSAPLTLLDCRQFVGAEYPFCYSGELHRELSRDGGETLYLTFAGQQPYDVTLVELKVARDD
jgi:hypothetical protein